MNKYIEKSREIVRRLAAGRQPPARTIAVEMFEEISAARAAGAGWHEIAEAVGVPEPSIRKAFYRVRKRREGIDAMPHQAAKTPLPPAASSINKHPSPGRHRAAEGDSDAWQEKVLLNGKRIKVPKINKYDISGGGLLVIGNTSTENVDILDKKISKDE